MDLLNKNISIEDFYEKNIIDINFDEILYETIYPETKNFYQPHCKNNKIDNKHRLYFHYKIFGNSNFKLLSKKQKKINIIHTFILESSENEEVKSRQDFAIKSYLKNKNNQVKLLCFGEENPCIEEINFIKIKSFLNCDDRKYYILNELIKKSLKFLCPIDYFIYTNSDCYVDENFYKFILNNNYNYIEFFRQEVFENNIVGLNKDGIDGFAAKLPSIKTIQEKIGNNDLFIGSPYWDAVVSNIAKEHIKNTYQDKNLIFHKKHEPRWSLKSLDLAGINNLKTLNYLFDKKIIHCRKTEIDSKNLVIRLINEKTNIKKMKDVIFFERFGNNDIDFDYNYLFIEENNNNHRKVTDESLGTTAGTRYFVEKYEINKIIENYKKQINKFILLDTDVSLSNKTNFHSINENRLGIVFSFFGNDHLRINAAKKSVEELKKQTIWYKSNVVFIEMILDGEESNFNYSKNKDNIEHIKIYESKLNKNLFQKECLWNIGAKIIENKVDNFIFIDIDTFSQDKKLFAKAKKILELNSDIIFQLGNCIVTKKENGDITRVQWLWNSFSKLEAKNSYCFNPCGGFAISKKIYNQINGFNPYGFLYGGDILFLYEIDNRTHKIWNYNIKNLKIFQKILRNVKNENIILKNEESPLIHCWHGDHVDRPYQEWGLCFNFLNFSFNEIKLDRRGLLSWVDQKVIEKYNKFFKNKHLIKSAELDGYLYL